MLGKCGLARVSLERNQLAQFDRYRLFCAPRISICYIEQSHKMMALESIDYNIRIKQGLAVVEMIQVYKNTLEVPEQVNYLYSIQPNAVFTKMEIEFGEKRLLGIIKEKSVAKQEFKQGVEEGKTMVYSEKDDEFPDIMRVKLGNLAPKSTLKITFEYAQLLEVCVNKFWKLSIEPIVSPRYHLNKNTNSLIEYVNRIVDISSVSTNYKQNISIDIDMGTPITFIKSPTHELINMDANFDIQAKSTKTQFILDPNQNISPSKTFVLLLANETIHKPTAILTHTNDDALAHQKYCATISFIPQFNKLPLDDAYSTFLEEQNLESQRFDFPQRGEYIFLIDRSGSMAGSRIEKAKEALSLFIKSLPTDSYFNIISFGSNYQKLYNESQKYDVKTMEEALSQINQMQADLGGTEILSPFQDDVYKQKEIPDYPKNIFLLTDGEVTPDPVVNIVRQNCKPSIKVYTIGIGDGCSKFLVEKVAAVGNGKCQFIQDDENMTAKVIDLLQDSITPYLQSFKMESSVIDTFSVVPNPEILQSLKKNTPFTMQFLFPQQPDDVKMINFSFQCFDPQLKEKMGCEIELNIAESKDTPYFHKLAAYKQITAIEDACKFRDEFVNGCLINRPAIKLEDIVEISVQHQILSRATAFICEVAELEDNWKQLIKNQNKIEVPVFRALLISSIFSDRTKQNDQDLNLKDHSLLFMSYKSLIYIPPQIQMRMPPQPQMNNSYQSPSLGMQGNPSIQQCQFPCGNQGPPPQPGMAATSLQGQYPFQPPQFFPCAYQSPSQGMQGNPNIQQCQFPCGNQGPPPPPGMADTSPQGYNPFQPPQFSPCAYQSPSLGWNPSIQCPPPCGNQGPPPPWMAATSLQGYNLFQPPQFSQCAYQSPSLGMQGNPSIHCPPPCGNQGPPPPPGMAPTSLQGQIPFQPPIIRDQMKESEKELDGEQQSRDYRDIILYSQADGSFKCDQTLKDRLQINKIENNEQIPEIYWICIIALLYLELYCMNERLSWQLIFQKTIQFLKDSKINYQEIKSKISKEYQEIGL